MRSAASSPQFSAELIRCGSVPLLLGLLAAGMQGLPEQQAVSGSSAPLQPWCACACQATRSYVPAAGRVVSRRMQAVYEVNLFALGGGGLLAHMQRPKHAAH